MPVIGQAIHKQPELLPMAAPAGNAAVCRHGQTVLFFEVKIMNTLVIGNLVSLAGCILMVAIGFVRRKERILGLQCVQFGIMAAANILMGAYSGAIAGFVGIVRNLVFTKKGGTLPLKLFFIAIQVLLSWTAIRSGWLEWLPILSTILFTCFLDVRSETRLKAVLVLAQLFWLVYDLCYQNYVAAAFDIFTVASNIAGIVMIRKAKK